MKLHVRRLCLAAILTACALILFVVEAQFPSLTTIPGVKLGLSNIVTVFSLYTLGPALSLAILLARILLGALLTGQISAILYSLAGGLPAFALCALLQRCIPLKQLWVVSIFGAVMHNLGQLLAAVLITATPSLFYTFPFLCLAALFSGLLTGLCAQLLLLRLRKLSLVPVYSPKKYRSQT